ncbi:MAG: hypothetical protein R3185_07280, partial [Candidatus Thermoplasmatota archaeon]|nr:hypothetical protein [Candidatus Thermoplasmatota archaeon]
MDALAASLTWALMGGLFGAGASLVPGLHVNTLAALALAWAITGTVPAGSLVTGLLAALGAASVSGIVPL